MKDLSSKPPESETMHALKSGYCSAAGSSPDSAVSVSEADSPSGSSDARSPQAAKLRAAMHATAAIRAVFIFTAPPDRLKKGHRPGARLPGHPNTGQSLR